MTAAASAVAPPWPRSTDRSSPAWGLAAIAVIVGLQAWLVFFRAINWDEFWFYAQIEEFRRGELYRPLQTFHVRLFGWLCAMPGTAVDRIAAGRLFMLGCELVSAAAIICIARRFTDRTTAGLCAAAYLSAGFVLQHGFAFRADPIAAALLMSALCLLLRARLGLASLALFGLLVGSACLITIKSALYAPAFAGIAWLRWHESGYSRGRAAALAAAAMAAAACAAALYALHALDLPDHPRGDGGGKLLATSSRSMLFLGVPPYADWFGKFVLTAIPTAVLMMLAPGRLARSERPREQRIALFGLFLPIASLGFYVNTLPYFYAFILPPVLAACVASLPAITRAVGAAAVGSLLVANAILVFAAEGSSRIGVQRDIQYAAAEIFPHPVAYFDFAGMLPQFHKANGFMTRWGHEAYLANDSPAYRNAMLKRPVPLLLLNDHLADARLSHLMLGDGSTPLFHPLDRSALKGTYRKFWGPFWLAGIAVPAGGTTDYDPLVPGPYTVKGGSISIDGRSHQPGSVVDLSRRRYRLSAEAQASELVWGRNLQAPARPAPPHDYWTDF